jgi:hypothetical protein
MTQAATAALGVEVVSAASDKDDNGAATFTKWITDFPNMAGVVGGSVGEGVYSGKVLEFTPGPTTVIAAIYHFGGSKHDFTALMHVELTGLQAVLSGVIIDGWHKGRLVTGEYTQIRCEHDGLTTDCFTGSVRLGHGGD